MFCRTSVAASSCCFAHITNIVLAGKDKPTESLMKRLLGARKHMVPEINDCTQGNDTNFVNSFSLARIVPMIEAILDT